MPDHLTIVSTADGSKTIYNALVGENYHSKHGALQESKHVFVQSGLEHFLAAGDGQIGKVSILEVGFGTGLNFLLTADYCTGHNVELDYTGIEAYPLSAEMIAQTGYDEYVTPAIWEGFLSSYPGALTGNTSLNHTCRFNVAVTQLADFSSPLKYDVIYFDAFAAVHQPEMWSDEAIAHTLQFLKPGGVFVTYAITGNLKRAVKAHGLKVEKAPGAPGKREMLRATSPL